MSWIEKRYILEISTQLEHFKQRKDNLFSFRCPYCGDSQKKKFKTRGFLYEKNGEYFFRCHNCNYGTSLGGLIKHLDQMKYRQYMLDKFGNSREEVPLLKTEIKHIVPKFKQNIQATTIDKLDDDHWVKQYVIGRKIPEKYYSSLYYAPSFKDVIDNLLPNHDKDLIEDDSRLIIPFYNEEKTLIGLQGRSLGNNKIKYITIKTHESYPKMFGLDGVKKDQTIYVLEGPIDSMMLDNAVAVCDSSLRGASKYLPKENLVLVFDNQYYNREVQQQIERSIQDGYKVCLFPKSIKEKDLNEMTINCLSREALHRKIDSYTYSGLRAIYEFNLLKG